ncbi:hypothetical protein [Amycolatopsis sp. NPDC051903]|uniref:hypothetical protein n=1 Tax=Amycolatopsis sp. NPDC051903 TaxID=3363936 RepID=UPI00379A62A9
MSVLLLSAAACGERTVPAGPAPATSPPPAVSTTPATPGAPTGPTTPMTPPPSPGGPPQSRPTQGVPPGDTAPAPGQVDASALPAGYPHDVTLAQGGKVVVIHAEEAGCDHLSAAAGEQTAQHVVVRVTVTKAPRGQMCPMHVREVSLPVPLGEPLGGRTLVLQPGP